MASQDTIAAAIESGRKKAEEILASRSAALERRAASLAANTKDLGIAGPHCSARRRGVGGNPADRRISRGGRGLLVRLPVPRCSKNPGRRLRLQRGVHRPQG